MSCEDRAGLRPRWCFIIPDLNGLLVTTPTKAKDLNGLLVTTATPTKASVYY